MNLYTQIQQAYMHAFKAKDTLRKDILWYMFAQLKNKAIDTQKELTDEEVIQAIKKEIKTRQESITYAISAGKTQNVLLDEQKTTVLEEFIPKQFTADELMVLIKQTIQELWLTDLQKQRGQLIWALMKSYSTQIDGKLLNECITSLL